MSDEPNRKKRHRSPAYPSLSLGEAIEKIGVLYDKEKRHPVPVAVAASHFGYDIKSSSALRAIAALKHFGLATEMGASDDRKIKVSDLALDILLSESSASPKRIAALKKAAMLPEVFAKTWEHYKGDLPSDATLKEYLIRSLDFNDSVVGLLINKFRSTLALAKITTADKIGDGASNGGKNAATESQIAVGAFVQWTSQGADQFAEPKRVRELSEDGEWALLDGEDTGVAVSELSVVDPPDSGTQGDPPKPPRSENPFKPQRKSPFISFPLGADNVMELRLTKPVSKKDFERLKKLIDLSEDSLVEQGE